MVLLEMVSADSPVAFVADCLTVYAAAVSNHHKWPTQS